MGLVNGHKLLFLVITIIIFQESLMQSSSQSKFLLFSSCIITMWPVPRSYKSLEKVLYSSWSIFWKESMNEW